MLVIWVIVTAIGVLLALIVPWFPSKGSVQLGTSRTLYDVLLIATVPIFVLVVTVVPFSVWKFRMRPGRRTWTVRRSTATLASKSSGPRCPRS